MLARLSIRDIVLIDKLDLEFVEGLTALTGETGAGKSILLDSLALALGARGDGGLVRQGKKQGQVSAVFHLPADHPANAALAANDLPREGELILRRVQMSDGRTRAYVNDQSVSVQSLRAVAAALVELHGQHDDRAMTDLASHRALVDLYGPGAAMGDAVRGAHQRLRAIEKELTDERARVNAAALEADFASHAYAELTTLAVRSGEETELAAQRTNMMQAEKVVGDIREARDSTSGDASVLPVLAAVARKLHRRMSQAPALIEPCVSALDDAMEALEAAARMIDAALDACGFDAHELERCEERLFALRAASRKYGVSVDALPKLAEKFASDLQALNAGRSKLETLACDRERAFEAYRQVASALSAARAQAAKYLAGAVNAELPPLKLERARFDVVVDRDDEAISPDGYDHIEFVVTTNPGSRPGPMMKVASGGELARFLLALKVVLAEKGTAPTLVFDEIDTGVGGAVADAIGQRLARLGARSQVLAVTHAPQVAARADSHMRIVKLDVADADWVVTHVETLDRAARKEEIARMLAGAEITGAARAAASSLIRNAG